MTIKPGISRLKMQPGSQDSELESLVVLQYVCMYSAICVEDQSFLIGYNSGDLILPVDIWCLIADVMYCKSGQFQTDCKSDQIVSVCPR